MLSQDLCAYPYLREVAALTGWMREFNMKRPAQERVGFYGLDVYSLMESLEAIVKFMRSVDGDESIKSAERALACFERVATMGKEDVGQAYGMAAALTPYSCRNEVVKLLVKVREEAAKLSESPNDEEANENALSAELNTKVRFITSREKSSRQGRRKTLFDLFGSLLILFFHLHRQRWYWMRRSTTGSW